MTRPEDESSFVKKLRLSAVLNGSGGWTAYGATRVSAECMEAARTISRYSVIIDELQDLAAGAISAATGAESGMVVNCSAAGIVVTVAACITGTDVARAKRLPDTLGLRNRIVLQKSHNTDFGAPVDQMIRLGGGVVHEIGWCNQCEASELDLALQCEPAAALYVVSYETLATAQLPLPIFLEKCRNAGVFTIVDIAGEQDPAHYLCLGADLVIISAQKQLGGLTAGVIAGRKSLIEACRIQMGGVGRPGKASKESIASTIVAISALSKLGEREAATTMCAEAIIEVVNEIPELVADAFSYPVPGEAKNVRIRINPEYSNVSIEHLARNLEIGTPRVVVRKDQLPAGYIVLNPREIDEQDISTLAAALLRAVRTNR